MYIPPKVVATKFNALPSDENSIPALDKSGSPVTGVQVTTQKQRRRGRARQPCWDLAGNGRGTRWGLWVEVLHPRRHPTRWMADICTRLGSGSLADGVVISSPLIPGSPHDRQARANERGPGRIGMQDDVARVWRCSCGVAAAPTRGRTQLNCCCLVTTRGRIPASGRHASGTRHVGQECVPQESADIADAAQIACALTSASSKQPVVATTRPGGCRMKTFPMPIAV